MATARQDSPDTLREEILADARREGEAVVARARQEAEALLAKTKAEAERARQERLAQAHAEAARVRELILATVAVEAGQLRSKRIELLLQSVEAGARDRLRARKGFDYRETITALAAEAVSRMAGEAFVLKLASADNAAFAAGLVEEVVRRVGRTPLRLVLADEAAISEGGVVIQDAEGCQVWDDRLERRLARLWPELRRQIAVQAALVVPTGQVEGGG